MFGYKNMQKFSKIYQISYRFIVMQCELLFGGQGSQIFWKKKDSIFRNPPGVECGGFCLWMQSARKQQVNACKGLGKVFAHLDVCALCEAEGRLTTSPDFSQPLESIVQPQES